jgi:hypothetical protein
VNTPPHSIPHNTPFRVSPPPPHNPLKTPLSSLSAHPVMELYFWRIEEATQIKMADDRKEGQSHVKHIPFRK